MYLLIRNSDNAVMGCQFTSFGEFDTNEFTEISDYEGKPLPIHSPNGFFCKTISIYTPAAKVSTEDRIAALEKRLDKMAEVLKLEV